MDPVTALGVASSVVQLVDFAQSLVRSTYEIYKSISGQSSASVDLQTITTSLKTLNDDLRQSVESAALGKGKTPPSNNDAELLALCQNCNVVADKLISALDRLKAEKNHKIWDSFGRALLTVWTKKEVESLEKQLDQYRHQISLLINASVREQVTRLQADHSSQGQLICTSLQATQDLSQAVLKQTDQNAKWQAKVIEAINRSSYRLGKRIWDVGASPVNTRDQLYGGYAEQFRSELLASLHYIEMESRSENVSEAYEETFQWIFSPYSAANQKWSNFVQFLKSDQGLYWITGKPGSGKSTLMKYIKNDHRTAAHLNKWAGGKKLYLAGFYFWCAGDSEIQMTQEGLLRTLIHKALLEFPQLAPLLFPKRLETFVVFGGIVWGESWTLTELLSAFKLFIRETTKSYKIFLLIDGLDEFKGKYAQQVKLVEFIQSLLNSDVKLCVSSRPWNVFEDAFKTRPSLRLEDLTYEDIRYYCSTNLSNNPGFTALQCEKPRAASDLINNVSKKAEGVFLWVILVVQSLLEGLTDGERLIDLQKRLDSLPVDLEALFWRILNSVDFERISQLIQIVRASPGPISIVELSYADEDDPNFVYKLPTEPLSKLAFESRAELMRRRLNACCKGLLEPQGTAKLDPQAKVGYLHRTVKDFIEKPVVWDKLLEATNASFGPSLRLSISRLFSLKTIRLVNCLPSTEHIVVEQHPSVLRDHAKFWIDVVHCIWDIRLYGPKAQDTQVRLLEELKRTMEEIMNKGAYNLDRLDSYSEPLSYGDCPESISFNHKMRSFFHLAVRLQVEPYVRAHISDIQGPNQEEDLAFYLRISVKNFAFTFDETVSYNEPSLGIVAALLEHGAAPEEGWRDLMQGTAWKHVGKSAITFELLMLLLHNGADPFEPQLDTNAKHFAPEVLELVKAKRDEATRKNLGPDSEKKTVVAKNSELGPDSGKKTVVAKNSELLQVNAPSKWSRLRSRLTCTSCIKGGR
ncbi:uncharacterized protein PAC_15425 [Phialocephala subalpina]|uniref:Uncharacterized protein n=1 Tax=Phialocephala subalpina TaxID=576137 RepID=A0A1L7XKD7_9HELO|nr:uncharacterized protein PAC_15425 [Phialocephala subalpina]